MLAAAISLACSGSHKQGERMIPYSDLTKSSADPADQRIPYGTDPLQFGELRLPGGNERVPIVVLIHGGCWQAQYDIKHIEPAASALTRDGFATWTVEYRRLGNPGGGWPGTFDDISRAVDYVRTLAAGNPRIDTARVVLMGHSAGGQLALWAASRRQGEQTGLFASSAPPIAVAGVVSLAGITDMAAYGAAAGGCNQSVTPLMGGTPAEQAGHYAAVNPIERLPTRVPVHLVHGDADPIVPIAQGTVFATRDNAGGGTSVVDVVKGAGHFDLIAPQSDAWKTVLSAAHALADANLPPRVHAGP